MKLIDISILTNIKGLGAVNIVRILNYCKIKNINSVYELQNIDLSSVVSKKLANTITIYFENDLDNLNANMENIIDGYKEEFVHCISYNNKLYPNILKESTNPPPILYCKGNIDLLESNCVAVIGTRGNTQIGQEITVKTVDFLVKNKFTIVSGLANGIDEIAHKTTLENSGYTIAILPLIDIVYTASNRKLADSIINNNGLLISENKPNTRFNSGLLVKRDRIHSGLSKAVFVIESSKNGGSMHASNDAFKLNRLLYTPNIYKMKQEYQMLKQVEGIKILIDSRKSKPYSKNNYDELINQLNSKKYSMSILD